ncbi:MAG TPA: hydrogenase maturation nickel metallochaperone HypA [Bryobacteraceae bacterium]|jgi:hydrogenase nickel incorporation protein HypA/HybF
MHELSIAVSMIELAEEEAARRGGVQVSAIHLRLGRLSGVAREALESCYEIACAGTALEGSKLVIEEVPIVVYCSRCEARRTADSPQWFDCPGCGSPAEVVQGRELEIAALELEEAPA